MKLGILVTIISGFGKKGFYHSQEIGLAKTLVEMGHDVVIYKCVSRDKERFSEDIGEHIRIHYIPVFSLGFHGYCPPSNLDEDLDGLLSFADTQFFLPPVYRFCVKHQIAFVPYIGIAHSAQRNTKSIFMDFLFHNGTLKIYKKLPVLAKTDEVMEELHQLGVKDCQVTPVGLDTTELKTDFRNYDRNALREKYGYKPSDVIISFVGRMKVEKRPLDMVDIFDAVKDCKDYKMLMGGEGYQRDDIAAKVKAMGLSDRVQMIERVNYENMWEVHYISDYFVNLCYREIFGMALMEGIYYESSVAAVEAAGPCFILKGMEGHCLCKDDEGIKQWLRADKPDGAVLRQSSDRLIERFSWKYCAQAFADLTKEYGSRPERKGRA